LGPFTFTPRRFIVPKKRQSKTYVTTKDIVIPAGTEVSVDGPKTHTYCYEKASILRGETKDVTSEWSMDLREALDIGLVRELEVAECP
jgi:hypothetical protein